MGYVSFREGNQTCFWTETCEFRSFWGERLDPDEMVVVDG